MFEINEVPIRYKAREYGETQISRFSHGALLIKMLIFAFLKLKQYKFGDEVFCFKSFNVF